MAKSVLNGGAVAAAEEAKELEVLWVEDDFGRFVRENWQMLGLTPVFLNLLVEHKGWWAELVDGCFSELVGKDYADIKITEWIERLKGHGFEFPIGKPVLEVLHEVLIEAWGASADELQLHAFNGLN